MASPAKRSPPGNTEVEPEARNERLYEWFTVVQFGDNDFRVVSARAPLPSPTDYVKGQKMVIPEEIYDRWAIDAEPMLSRAVEEFR
jgi:hypothetical protein